MDTNVTSTCCSLVQAPGHSLRLERGGVRLTRLVFALCAGILLAAGGGCSALQGVRDYAQYNDVTDDFVVGWRNYVWANKAWHAEKTNYAGHPQLHDFGEGFRAGYRDVAAGSNGCPPPLPPRKYWSWKYQNPEGQAKVAAWFSGYPHGAVAAEQAGAGNWREIAVSHVIQQQYSPEFQRGMIPRCDGSFFPQPTDAWTTEPHDQPGQAQPLPYGMPAHGMPAHGNPPIIPAAPQGALPEFEQGSMRAAPSGILPVAAHRQHGEWPHQGFADPTTWHTRPGVAPPYPAWERLDSPPPQSELFPQVVPASEGVLMPDPGTGFWNGY